MVMLERFQIEDPLVTLIPVADPKQLTRMQSPAERDQGIQSSPGIYH